MGHPEGYIIHTCVPNPLYLFAWWCHHLEGDVLLYNDQRIRSNTTIQIPGEVQPPWPTPNILRNDFIIKVQAETTYPILSLYTVCIEHCCNRFCCWPYNFPSSTGHLWLWEDYPAIIARGIGISTCPVLFCLAKEIIRKYLFLTLTPLMYLLSVFVMRSQSAYTVVLSTPLAVPR